ncbi:Rv3235 family protein [Actinophytocola glycyrrhizae]|uniref:Rv3235 family protein n=1 Tax=Actinophytocola glycyrrhizae TaxID=2044873 RepID=A0ABV9RYY4_9PSEU
MTVPALPADEPCPVRLRRLPDYEPDDGDGPPMRWSSLRPATGPQLRLVPPLPTPDGPPVTAAALAHVLRRVLEVLDGRRQAGQLRSLLPDAAFEGLLTRLRTMRPGCRHTLRRMRMCFPTRTAVEVSAVMELLAPSGKGRVVAAAARFESRGDRWVCSVLRFL